jgi:hypothetical protein
MTQEALISCLLIGVWTVKPFLHHRSELIARGDTGLIATDRKGYNRKQGAESNGDVSCYATEIQTK